MDGRSSPTVIEALASSLETASAHNPDDAEKPAAILWADPDSQWRAIIPRLRRLIPQLLELGEYEPEHRIGPSIWLRCVVERALESPEIPGGATPIVYLPGVGRQALGAAETCPAHLKPLVELQYRGACWTQRNGRDWTVETFLVSGDGGLGLNAARDAATRQSLLRALAELATTSVRALQGRRLEADDFDRLFSDDPVRDVLVWLGDAEAVAAGWEVGRRSAFTSRCKADFGFDPDRDGALVAAERLGRRAGPWGSVWQRFAESPALYPGIPELLRRAMPNDLFVERRSSWPQSNERDEADLRRALVALESEAPPAARERIIELETAHGSRRDWVWAKLDHAPVAGALAPLAALAGRTSRTPGGASLAEMAKLYADEAWQVDAAALSSFAAVKSSVDTQAVSRALNAIYRPWLESAARHLQALADKEPLPGPDGQDPGDARVESGNAPAGIGRNRPDAWPASAGGTWSCGRGRPARGSRSIGHPYPGAPMLHRTSASPLPHRRPGVRRPRGSPRWPPRAGRRAAGARGRDPGRRATAPRLQRSRQSAHTRRQLPGSAPR